MTGPSVWRASWDHVPSIFRAHASWAASSGVLPAGVHISPMADVDPAARDYHDGKHDPTPPHHPDCPDWWWCESMLTEATSEHTEWISDIAPVVIRHAPRAGWHCQTDRHPSTSTSTSTSTSP